MARTSRTARIVAEDRARATGLTIDGAISSYHLSLRAAKLEHRGLLERRTVGQRFVFRPVSDLAERLAGR